MDRLNKLKATPLSGTDVVELVEGKANMVRYRDLHKFRTIDQVLGPHRAAFILFETSDGFGHWVAIYCNNNTLYFFNSYAGYPDDTLQVIDDEYRVQSQQDFPYLSQLMYNSPYELEYNDLKLQDKGGNIMTCGRWCALFILMRELPVDNFSAIFKSKYADDIVTIITAWINY